MVGCLLKLLRAKPGRRMISNNQYPEPITVTPKIKLKNVATALSLLGFVGFVYSYSMYMMKQVNKFSFFEVRFNFPQDELDVVIREESYQAPTTSKK